mmetsp:Transcript_30855/g.51056  ORF Transcript_30855/g.51056 Transcript_30855/m.51056 type:complete len:104 (+) Transcript_30855:88-399(+)
MLVALEQNDVLSFLAARVAPETPEPIFNFVLDWYVTIISEILQKNKPHFLMTSYHQPAGETYYTEQKTSHLRRRFALVCLGDCCCPTVPNPRGGDAFATMFAS